MSFDTIDSILVEMCFKIRSFGIDELTYIMPLLDRLIALPNATLITFVWNKMLEPRDRGPSFLYYGHIQTHDFIPNMHPCGVQSLRSWDFFSWHAEIKVDLANWI